jgi:hypothetical protein
MTVGGRVLYAGGGIDGMADASRYDGGALSCLVGRKGCWMSGNQGGSLIAC